MRLMPGLGVWRVLTSLTLLGVLCIVASLPTGQRFAPSNVVQGPRRSSNVLRREREHRWLVHQDKGGGGSGSLPPLQAGRSRQHNITQEADQEPARRT